MKNYEIKKNRFGFRKLSVGLTTVFLGSIFFFGGTQVAHAAVTTNPQDNHVSETTQVAQTKETPADQVEVKSQDSNKEEKTQNTNQKVEATVTKENVEVQKQSQEKTAVQEAATKTTANEVGQIKSVVTARTPEGAINPDGSTQLEEDNNPLTINVKVDAHKVASFNSSSFDINFGNTGDSSENNQKWIMQGYNPGDVSYIDSNQKYQLTYHGMGNFTVKVMGENSDVADASFEKNFNVIGTKATGKTELPVTVSYNGQVLSQNTFTANLVPVDRRIKHHEIAHLFSRGLTNDQSELISEADKNNKKLQYMVEWNWGQNDPVNDVKYDQTFSPGQTLLPDTIKVFRVYPDQLVDENGNRKFDLDSIYGKFDSETGLFSNEDTAFENFLKKNMYRIGEDGDPDTPVTVEDYINAKNNNQDVPLANRIKFDQTGKFTDGTHNWSTEKGSEKGNMNSPHSIFLIQMDTLLPENMPASWSKPGQGPSSTITIPNAVVTSDSTSGTTTFIGFNNGGSGYVNDAEFTANLHFADVTDPTSIIDLGGKDSIPESQASSNSKGATTKTKIEFDDAKIEEYIQTLKKSGYNFVGVSNGNITSGKYAGSTLYGSDKYDGSKFGNYDWNARDYTLNFVKLASSEKSISQSVKYVYENGPQKGKDVETSFAKPSSEILTFTQSQTIDASGNIVDPSTWSLKDGNESKFESIVIPDTVNDKTHYSIDFDNITLNGQKLAANDGVTVNKENKTITITFDKEQIADKTQFDLVVPYRLQENITVHYIDENEQGGSEISNALNSKVSDAKLHTSYTGDPESSTDNLTDETIKYLESLGYVLDVAATNGQTPSHEMTKYNSKIQDFNDSANKNTYNGTKLNFDNDENPSNQVYYVYFTHNVKEDQNVTQKKELAEVIHYVDEDNAADEQGKIKDLTQPSTAAISFTRNANIDQVTGKVVSWNNWTVASLGEQKNPEISGYTIDLNSKILSQKLNGSDVQLAEVTAEKVGKIDVFAGKDAQKEISALPEGKSQIEIMVPYKKNSVPVIPDQPKPTPTPEPTPEPDIPFPNPQPETPTPDNDIPAPQPHGSVAEDNDSNLDTFTKNNSEKGQTSVKENKVNKADNSKQISKNALPQTGEKQSNLGIVGMAMALVGLILGLGYRKRKD